MISKRWAEPSRSMSPLKMRTATSRTTPMPNSSGSESTSKPPVKSEAGENHCSGALNEHPRTIEPSKCHPLGRVSTGKKAAVPNSSLIGVDLPLPKSSFATHYSSLSFRLLIPDAYSAGHCLRRGDPFSHPSGSSAAKQVRADSAEEPPVFEDE